MATPYSMRRAAYQAVRGWSERNWRIETSISRIRDSQGMAVRDVATASDIAATVIKRLASIDAVLAAYSKRERKHVEDELWTLLQIGVAQLLFRPDIRPHAAVHETVAVADEVDKPLWKGFANGLLRSISRELEFQESVSFVNGLRCVAGQAWADKRWAVCGRQIVDGTNQDAEWLSRVYSVPRWLTRRWLEREQPTIESPYADADRPLDVILRGCNVVGPTWLRVNIHRQSRDDLAALLSQKFSEIEVVLGDVPEAIALSGPVTLGELPGFSEGSCSVQDLAAMQAVHRLAPQPGEHILDLCSAPGGKACHIADRLNGAGSVVAADISESRLARVRENMTRLELTNILPTVVDRKGAVVEGAPIDPGSFDAALVDVPCSNTGVLAKRPEVRWRIKPTDLEELPPLQLSLLKRAAEAVHAGGRIVYSTCSIEPEENDAVVAEFLRDQPEWSLTHEQTAFPVGYSDGGYHALLVHQAS